MKIKNGSSTPLNASAGGVPNVSGAMQGWFQPMIFETVSKAVGAFQAIEVGTETEFMGVWQPYGPRQLNMLPEGQRLWKWFTVHSTVALGLVPDDVIKYLGTQYRVKSDKDYSLYGYYEYELIEDFTGAGPETT